MPTAKTKNREIKKAYGHKNNKVFSKVAYPKNDNNTIKIDDNARLKEPSLLIVIMGGEMAYTRDDSVKIIPIGTLKD